MNFFKFSFFKFLLKNKPIIITDLRKKDLTLMFDKLDEISVPSFLDLLVNKVLFFGKIIPYSYYYVNKFHTKFDFGLQPTYNYSVEGKVFENSISLKYSFALNDLIYFSTVLFMPFFLIFKSIYMTDFFLLEIAILFYLFADFVFNFLILLNKQKYHKDFTKHFPFLSQ